MGILFISHTVQDNAQAFKVRDWLIRHGWNDIYLDVDPLRGSAPGQRWEDELKRIGERCSAVLVLISPAWIDSRWCQGEFLAAKLLGKRIFPIVVAPTQFDQVPSEVRATFQIADISSPEKEADGFEHLAIGLRRAGLNPNSFDWPPSGEPDRSVYRGLQSLDEEDAAIFFGREADITKAIDALTRMRDGIRERMLVIQGSSGSGKSSFLKAGIIARLKRDEENFVVLPVIRPGRAALSGGQGLAASLGCPVHRVNRPDDIISRFNEARASVVDRLRRYAVHAHETYNGRPPTIVVPIDQAEELFEAENAEAAPFLERLSAAVLGDGNAIIVSTIRTDAFSRMQEEQRLCDLPILPFSLGALPPSAFKEVIEGPARLAQPPLTIEPALTEQLLKDLAAEDALPLLAFTLERLLTRRRGTETLTLVHYKQELGGLEGAIAEAVEHAFSKAMRDPALPASRVKIEELARAAFIPALAQIDDANAEPRRRIERLSALPEASRPLVHHLVDERLLVAARRTVDGVETDTVEVAHEAILRQWPALRSWIADERDALRALDGVRAAAREWSRHSGSSTHQTSWLTHSGGRLEEAEDLLRRPYFANALSGTEAGYLGACRGRENDANARARRIGVIIASLIAAAGVIVLVSAIGVAMLMRGISARGSDTLAQLAQQAADRDDDDRAERYALAGLAGADLPVMGFPAAAADAALRRALSDSQTLAVLRGHERKVWNAAFSPDGSRIVTASEDKTARIWDAKSGVSLAVLRGHGDVVEYAAYSPDGARIVTASKDKTARIWDAKRGVTLAVLRGHGDMVVHVAFSPDGTRIVTASDDRTARIWDAKSGAQLSVLRGHEGKVWFFAFSHDGARIVTASEDNTAKVWDAKSGVLLSVLRGHEDVVERAAFSPDDERIVTAAGDKTARIWDATSGVSLAVLHGHEGIVDTAVFSPDGSRIVTASADTTARIWDAKTGAQLALLRGHEGTIWDAAFSPDGRRIITASADRTARIWDATSGVLLTVLRGHESGIESAVFSPDGTRVVTASDDATARVWDTRYGAQLAVKSGQESQFTGAAFSPDGTRIATASDDKTARIWDAKTGAQLAVLRGHEGIVASAAFSPDGTRIATASEDRTARIWDAKNGVSLAVLRGHDSEVFSAAFSPDSTRIATASGDRTARIWDAKSGVQLAVLRGHENQVISAAFSPDGTRIVTASDDSTARVWDVKSGTQLAVLRGHEGKLERAAFSPDGMRIVTAADDTTARIWDAKSGAQLAVLQGHEGILDSAAFSPDGERILTASEDKTARIWASKNGTELKVLRGHEGAVTSAAFSPDGTRIATASADGTARVWTLPPDLLESRAEMVRRACSGLQKNGASAFTPAELQAAPVLDPRTDSDACRRAGLWTRAIELFGINSF